MKIAVEGCCHGELDKIYETIGFLEKKQGVKVDLLLCCGDFQAVRNPSDLHCMAVPPKYQKMNTFYKYYSGEKKAPILTIFIGGNHEASNYLQELPYGGWVAPNIYYLGYAGVVQVGGVRIGGLSGIYKNHDYNRGHYEHVPYDDDSKRSVYHIRNLEVFRLKQISRNVDIFLTHDWPTGIYNHGNWQQLVRCKPYFEQEIKSESLGSKPAEELLYKLQPTYWFSAHLHVKFAALVQHQSTYGKPKQTRFLALDKCLPRRRFLQLLDIPHNKKDLSIELDPEWLAILKMTNHLLSLRPTRTYMPGPGSDDRYDFTVPDEDIEAVTEDFGGDLSIPNNFEPVAETYFSSKGPAQPHRAAPPTVHINPQTTLMCEMLGITDPSAQLTGKSPKVELNVSLTQNPEEIVLNEESEEEEEEGPSYDSFIVSHDSSSMLSSELDQSASVADDSLSHYTTALQSLTDTSQEEGASQEDEGASQEDEGASQEDEGVGGSQEESGISGLAEISIISEGSPAQANVSSSSAEILCDKDTQSANASLYISLTEPSDSDSVSPKRTLEDTSTSHNATEASQKSETDDSETPSQNSEPKAKKFKRRNQSFYASTGDH